MDYLTGNRNGFRGEYNRADFRIYLNKNHLKLGRTVEPLHRMMELATVHCNQDRITIEECFDIINQALAPFGKDYLAIINRAKEGKMGSSYYPTTGKTWWCL